MNRRKFAGAKSHRTRMGLFFLFAANVSLTSVLYCQDIDNPAIDPAIARQYFTEAKQLFGKDAGELWGISLDGPIMLVDANTRIVVTNQADVDGQLKKTGEVFSGRLPPQVMVANTAAEWSGTKWTMLLWPLPEDEQGRRVLLAHEAWHRVQDDLGFKSSGAQNKHLGTLQGRYLLQLEWRALAAALQHTVADRKQAISDALHFRAFRHQVLEGSSEEEREMELHEGLAEYTGVRLALKSNERINHIVKNLENRPAKLKSFARSFAYLSGPAYGLLLEQFDEKWIAKLSADSDLGTLLQKAADIRLADDLETRTSERSLDYRGPSLLAAEEQKDAHRKAIIEGYIDKFVHGPRLIFPLSNMQMSFNPNELIPIETHGTIYPTLSITDQWGVLEVTNGALITADFQQVVVSVPAGYSNETKTEEWNVDLNDDWTIDKNEDKSFAVTKNERR